MRDARKRAVTRGRSASDDVIVDGRIITGEDYISASDGDDIAAPEDAEPTTLVSGYVKVKKLTPGG